MRILFFILFLLSYLTTFGQQGISVAEFLSSAIYQEDVLRQEGKVDYLKSSTIELPWINEVEFRVRTNEFDFDLNRYTVRAKPNTPRQRSSQRYYQKSSIAVNEVQEIILLSTAFKMRYQTLADWYYTKQMLAGKEKLKVLFLDKINAIKNSVATKNFDINDLISAENDLNELERDVFVLNKNLNQLRIKLTDFTNMKNISDINIDHFISIKDLKKYNKTIFRTKTNNHPLVRYYDEKVNLVEREYNIKKANEANYLDYVETKYENKKRNIFNERFAIGVGIIIPTKGSNNLTLNKLRVKKISEENKRQNQKDVLVLQKKLFKNRLESLIEEYDLVNSQIENSRAGKTIEQYEKYGNISVFTLLDIQEGILKKSEEITKLNYQILLTYIELLDVYGKFTERPMRNYFSETLEKL